MAYPLHTYIKRNQKFEDWEGCNLEFSKKFSNHQAPVVVSFKTSTVRRWTSITNILIILRTQTAQQFFNKTIMKFDGTKNEGVFILKAKMQLHNSLWCAHLQFITSFMHTSICNQLTLCTFAEDNFSTTVATISHIHSLSNSATLLLASPLPH